MMADFMVIGSQCGCASLSSAASPLTCGHAMLVPAAIAGMQQRPWHQHYAASCLGMLGAELKHMHGAVILCNASCKCALDSNITFLKSLLTGQIGELEPSIQWAVGRQYILPCRLDGRVMRTNNTITHSCKDVFMCSPHCVTQLMTASPHSSPHDK